MDLTALGKAAEAGDPDWAMKDCPKMLHKLSLRNSMLYFLRWKNQFLDYVERYQFPKLFDIKALDFLADGDDLLDPQVPIIYFFDDRSLLRHKQCFFI